MTLADILHQKLAEWQPPSGRQALAAADPISGWAVHLMADCTDALGCLVWELAVVRTGGTRDGGGGLQAWADGVSERATGLLEPLKVHEVDVARDEALLRSDEPSQRGDHLSYYEVLLTGTGSAVLRRYRAERAGKREQIAFALTHEALAKVVRGLTGTK